MIVTVWDNILKQSKISIAINCVSCMLVYVVYVSMLGY